MYKWHKLQWQNIMQRKDQFPHAMLLRGRAGVGKLDFSIALSQALLCTDIDDQGMYCGKCPSCIWFTEGHHPDFRLVSPEDEPAASDAPKKATGKKNQISVSQIRQLTDFLNLSSHQQGRRIVLISPADLLNLAAANALLKMLEEPPENTLFLLVSSQPQKLLPTIISRCQVLDLPLPSKEEALSWLQLQNIRNAEKLLDYSGGAPLLALESNEKSETSDILIKHLSSGNMLDPYATAPLFLGLGMPLAIEFIQKWIFDLLNFRLTRQFHYFTGQSSALQALCKSVNLGLLLKFQQNLIDAKKTANHPLSNEMQLENLLVQYTYIFKR